MATDRPDENLGESEGGHPITQADQVATVAALVAAGHMSQAAAFGLLKGPVTGPRFTSLDPEHQLLVIEAGLDVHSGESEMTPESLARLNTLQADAEQRHIADLILRAREQASGTLET